MKKTPLLFLAISILFGLGSCKVYKQSILFNTEKQYNVESVEQQVDLAQRNYTVKPFDYITFNVFTNGGERIIDPDFELVKDMSANMLNRAVERQYIVRPDGTADLPMIGNLKIDGLKLHQLDSVLALKYNLYYNNCYVISRIANKRIVMLGALGGQVIPLQNENMKLIEALALAASSGQSTSQRFKAQNIRLIRGDLKDPQVFLIDLSTIEGMRKSQLILQPDDIIYVEPVVRVFIETVRDAAPIIGLVTNVITLLLVIQSVQNK